MDSQTAGPIAIKFNELETKTSGFSYKLKKFLKNLINILIDLITSVFYFRKFVSMFLWMFFMALGRVRSDLQNFKHKIAGII